MTARARSLLYAEATPVLVTHPMAAPQPRAAHRSGNGTIFGRGLATLGESVLVALALPFIILGLGLPVVLLARLMLEIFRAFR